MVWGYSTLASIPYLLLLLVLSYSASQVFGRGIAAVYVAFGQAFGIYDGDQLDVHGAGAQRSDPKSGNAADWSDGFGPQNDEIRIDNAVRCVRNA